MNHAEKGTAGWHGATIMGDLPSCWLCRRPVEPQTLHCASCGALQPLHEVNYFALLGLEERFDLDLANLERHYATARRALDRERIGLKASKVGALAEHCIELMATAYETLRDPMARGRYLLGLLDAVARSRCPTDRESDSEIIQECAEEPPRRELDALATALATADDGLTIDRLGTRIGQEIESGMHTLSSAFRAGRVDEARLALARLDRLQALSVIARKRRLDLCPPPASPVS